ncbi:winged helix-turn-helix domain-containing protein [Inediibacterium massiliense]|uniref:winged helix-turn-helix domain-containing protein n=1 Tax=Inediibacterium massiliense TaxID=1658111 RepID=UPI0006B46EBF|nr:transcriptional regulator [Inediibacterium massiliense]
MEINSIPEAFQSKMRLAIVATLITGEKKSFNQIKETTKGTDGNLSSHLTKLEQMGYLDVKKQFIGKKTCTTYSLTRNGKLEFEEYVKLLEQILKSVDLT